MKLPWSLLALDGTALLLGAGGVALMARGAPTPQRAYATRITGALAIAIALFLGGFTTAAYLTS